MIAQASPSIYQGDLVLQGKNYTIIEGRFDINGSIIIKENATLHLLNAYINFIQNGDRQHNITLRNPPDGNPHLLVYDSTITSPNIIDAYITDNSIAEIKNSTITYDIYASDYSVTLISLNSDLHSLYMWGSSTARIYNSTLSRYEASYDYTQAQFQDSEINSLFIAPWSVRCTISNLKPGTINYWNFITNSSIDISGWGRTPNVTLTNTKINEWEFGFYGNSNATIKDSTIKVARTRDSAICRLLNTTYTSLQTYDQAEIQIILYLDVHVTDSIDQNVPSANVTATYMNTTIAEQKLTNTNGKTRLTLLEKIVNATGEYSIGNYGVEATYEIYSTSASLNITEQRQITLKLENLVIPEFPYILILPLFIIAPLMTFIIYRRKRALENMKKQ
jgi:hypothetical protein